MPIIVSRDGRDARRIERTVIEQEEYLQAYVTANPECLPLDEVDEGLILQILAREFPTPSGPIDALGVDQTGAIYIVETKLYKNPDKRLVLAQVLDYGASLWRASEDPGSFIEDLDAHLHKQRDVSLRDQLAEAYGLEEDGVDDLIDAMADTVTAGSFRYVVLMDRLHDRLRDLITYINQNSQFSVYGVELDYYVHEGLEILIPRLYGAEVRRKSTSSRNSRRAWTESEFFERAGEELSVADLGALRRLYDYSVSIASRVTFGTGVHTATFNVKFDQISSRALYTVTASGLLWLNFHWIDTETAEGAKQRLLAFAEGIDVDLPVDAMERAPEIPIEKWGPQLGGLELAIREAVPAGTGSI